MKTLRLNKQESQIVLPEGVSLVKTRNPKSMHAAAQGTYLRAMLGDVELGCENASTMTSAVLRRAFSRKIAHALKRHTMASMTEKPTRGGKREGAGRKAKEPGEKLVTVSVCVSPVAAQKLSQAARLRGVSKSKVADKAFQNLRS